MPAITAERPATRPQTFAERVIASVDTKLEAMAPADRLPALRDAQVKFIAMSEAFALRVDSGLMPEWAETGFDYAILLADISLRIAREERR